MDAGSGKIAFKGASKNVHQGIRMTSLLVSVAPTTLPATYSGTRMGIILLYEIQIRILLETANYLRANIPIEM